VRYHDYTEGHNFWGHALVSLRDADHDGTRAATIIGPRLSAGEVVLLSSSKMLDTGDPGVLQYRVVGDVRTPMDPGDMHHLTLSFMEAETNAAEGKDPRA
jgi:hypothetical protein